MDSCRSHGDSYNHKGSCKSMVLDVGNMVIVLDLMVIDE